MNKKNEPPDMPRAAPGSIRLKVIGGGGGSRTCTLSYCFNYTIDNMKIDRPPIMPPK